MAANLTKVFDNSVSGEWSRRKLADRPQKRADHDRIFCCSFRMCRIKEVA